MSTILSGIIVILCTSILNLNIVYIPGHTGTSPDGNVRTVCILCSNINAFPCRVVRVAAHLKTREEWLGTP